jgi:hypothetical protein
MSFLYSRRQILKPRITENITVCIVFSILLLLTLLTPRSRHFCEANIQLTGQETCRPTFLKPETLSAAPGFYTQPQETNAHHRTHLFNIYVYYLTGLILVPSVLSFFQIL